MKYLIILLIGLCPVKTILAQQEDSLFTYENFINQVLSNHPVSKIADLEIDKARAILLDARSQFEPALNAYGNSKTIDSKNYWDKRSVNVSIATAFAASFKTGFETADGDFLNPENSTAQTGQWFAEIQLPLLQGLLTDKRRIQLQKAENQMEASGAQRRIIQNKLLTEATDAYWSWKQAWEQLQLSRELSALALTRHKGVVEGYENGDFAAIDTLESYNQWLNRTQQIQQSVLDELTARATLASFLWNNTTEPTPFPEMLQPGPATASMRLIDTIISQNNLLQIAQNLPQATLARFNRENKALENRLARENLKPELNISWKQFSSSDFSGGAVDIADNQVALSFKVPLFLRSSRAAAQASKIQLNTAEFRLHQKLRELSLKIQAKYQSLEQLNQQQNTVNKIAQNFLQLVEAEEREFLIGESSLFLVNQRENNYQEAQLKAIKVENKFSSRLFKLYWTLRQDLELDTLF